jgi:endo-1,4-beta-xylanase
MSEIASRGLKIILSELNVYDSEGGLQAAAVDRAVADLYGRFLATALDERAGDHVVVWGLSDRYY